MVNSLMEYNCEYLRDLREKFRQQEYPLKLINEQFKRALNVNRADLLLSNNNNYIRSKRRSVIAPLVITYNPGNPPFKNWINTYCVYVLTCNLCSSQYTGQTTQNVQKRHYGHRSEVKRGEEGMGNHFYNHAKEMGINLETNLDDIMKHCKLTIVASVEPGAPGCKGRLDRLEADIQNRFMTMERHGGMNLREEVRRGRGMGQ